MIRGRDSSDEGSPHMFFMQNEQKLSLIITKYSLLSRALLQFTDMEHSGVKVPLNLDHTYIWKSSCLNKHNMTKSTSAKFQRHCFQILSGFQRQTA